MSNKSFQLPDDVHRYLIDVSLRETGIQRRLREETAKLPQAGMQIAPEQGQFMALLVKLLGARKTVEVGVFTGYSSLTTALALPGDGELFACDINAEWTGVAQRYWREAGVSHKIRLRLGPAAETLDALLEEGHQETVDFAFIDADKVGYPAYYEKTLRLLRPGGLVVFDNMLWSGKVADPQQTDTDTETLRALSRSLRDDDRIDVSLIPVADGLTLARKRD